ncbi:hypothetical protein DXG01_007469 [Tephrocybe rancida]|nr:hypothetical protein DXG01_007469 [Tephrocybe rancida]
MPSQNSVNCGRCYNAFGYDPNGRLAAIAATLYGPTYTPGYDVKQFVGKPEPPRFGPPSPFQLRSLPGLSDGSWKPTRPPGAPSVIAADEDNATFSDFLDPPTKFTPRHFDGLSVEKRQREFREGDDGYETEEVDEEEMARAWKRRRVFPERCRPRAAESMDRPEARRVRGTLVDQAMGESRTFVFRPLPRRLRQPRHISI